MKTLLILGVALVLAMATATVYTQSAFAATSNGGTGGAGGDNGVTDGQPEHGE
jgi:hypothetical protein